MKYSFFVIVCLTIHAIVNIDIFRKKPTVYLPAIRPYRVFVVSIAAFFITDLLWGVFDENHLAIALYADTFIFFLAMGFTILSWTRYVISYLGKDKHWFGKALMIFGNLFFLAEVILLIITCFPATHILFTVNFETGAYEAFKARNIMLYVQILMYVVLLVYSAVHAFRLANSFRRKYMTICLYSIIMATAISVQVYYPLLPVYSVGCIVGSCMLNSFLITDIKDEYKSALELSRVEVAKRKKELSETRIIAYSDPLTGIKNKHAYVEEEERIDKLIGKNEMGDFAVIVFDLNGLKIINDTKGHDAGDVYIVDACRTIEKFFGEGKLFRFGGDEFVIILEGEDFKERNKKLAEFEKYIDGCIGIEGKPIISSGLSRYRAGQDNTYHAVFQRADKFMYARKDQLKEKHV